METGLIYAAIGAALAAGLAGCGSAIGVGKAQQNTGEYVFDGDFLVVLGADW